MFTVGGFTRSLGKVMSIWSPLPGDLQSEAWSYLSVSLSGLFRGAGWKRICQVSQAVATCARAEPVSRGCPCLPFSPSRWVVPSQVDPAGHLSHWLSESPPWEGCIAHTHKFCFSEYFGSSKRGGGKQTRGSCSKPAFIMEEINLSRVIFLSQEEINF